jgi:hypothetical protein
MFDTFHLRKSSSNMAFDQPIEADRIGDFNLFSAFVRFPLMLLEGVLGKQGSNDQKDSLDSQGHREQSTATGYPDIYSNNPSRIVSNDELSSKQNANDDVLQNRTNKHALGRSRSSRPSSLTDLGKPSGLKRTSRMSWSDESGHSLVEYSDKVSPNCPLRPFSFMILVDCSFWQLEAVFRRVFCVAFRISFLLFSCLLLWPPCFRCFLSAPSAPPTTMVEVAREALAYTTSKDLQMRESR